MARTVWNKFEVLNAPAEEAYRALRTNIQFCAAGKKLKTIAVTSSAPGEGKTTVSINLSIFMANAGLKVLLIDADMRKPAVSERFRGFYRHGLASYISGFAPLEDIIFTTGTPNLQFIPCGPIPPNPTELLGASMFKELVKNIAEKYDIIIFDTPPLGSVIDCALISAQVDGTIVVIRSGKIANRNVRLVKEQLERVNARLLGVVLNRVKKVDYKGYYNYYYNNEKRGIKGLLQRLNIFRSKERREFPQGSSPPVDI